MDRSSKCPKCSAPVDLKADAIPKKDWPMAEWPIYQCRSCGAMLEEDNRNMVFETFGVVLIIGVTQSLASGIGYLFSAGNEYVANTVGLIATIAAVYWFVKRPKQLGERGQYGKQQ